MTLGILILQVALYIVIFGVSFFCIFVHDEYNTAGIITLVVGTVINVVLSCIYAWCIITVWLTIVAISFILFAICAATGANIVGILSFAGIIVSVLMLLVVGIIYLTGGSFRYSTSEIAYVKDQRTNIVSSADKGIANTTINGSSNLLFGRVSGSTTLTYYYSYYYQDEDGALNIGSIPASATKLYTISNDEQPYVVKFTNYHKTVEPLTGFASKFVHSGRIYYELYVPESAIPTVFTYNLN